MMFAVYFSAACLLLGLASMFFPKPSKERQNQDAIERIEAYWQKQGHPDPKAMARTEIHVLAAMEKIREWVSERYVYVGGDPRGLAGEWIKQHGGPARAAHGDEFAKLLRNMVKNSDPDAFLQGKALKRYWREADDAVRKFREKNPEGKMSRHYERVFAGLRGED